MKLTSYEQGKWDMFELISSVYYGKQYYFLNDHPKWGDDERVYSRMSHKNMSIREAYDEFFEAVEVSE